MNWTDLKMSILAYNTGQKYYCSTPDFHNIAIFTNWLFEILICNEFSVTKYGTKQDWLKEN